MNEQTAFEKLNDLITRYSQLLMGLRYGGPKMESRYSDKQWKINNKKGRFGYVPSYNGADAMDSITMVYSLIKNLRPKCRPAFIDAGCGCGNVLAIARVSGFDVVHGIEIDPETVKLANKFMELMFYNENPSWIRPIPKIINGDIVKFDKYRKYDCVYVYQPIYNSRPEMSEFLKNLSNTMKVNSYVIFHATSEKFGIDERFKHVDHCIYKKINK